MTIKSATRDRLLEEEKDALLLGAANPSKTPEELIVWVCTKYSKILSNSTIRKYMKAARDNKESLPLELRQAQPQPTQQQFRDSVYEAQSHSVQQQRQALSKLQPQQYFRDSVYQTQPQPVQHQFRNSGYPTQPQFVLQRQAPPQPVQQQRQAQSQRQLDIDEQWRKFVGSSPNDSSDPEDDVVEVPNPSSIKHTVSFSGSSNSNAAASSGSTTKRKAAPSVGIAKRRTKRHLRQHTTPSPFASTATPILYLTIQVLLKMKLHLSRQSCREFQVAMKQQKAEQLKMIKSDVSKAKTALIKSVKAEVKTEMKIASAQFQLRFDAQTRTMRDRLAKVQATVQSQPKSSPSRSTGHFASMLHEPFLATNSSVPAFQSSQTSAFQSSQSSAFQSPQSSAFQSPQSSAFQSSQSSAFQSSPSLAFQPSQPSVFQSSRSSSFQSPQSLVLQSYQSPRRGDPFAELLLPKQGDASPQLSALHNKQIPVAKSDQEATPTVQTSDAINQ